MINGMNSFKTKEGKKDLDPYYNIKLSVTDFTSQNFGLLNGPAFTLIYAVLILFTGPLSDNLNRTKMICFSCIGWSTMTYLMGFATEFWHLLICRTGLAVFMSFYGPTTLSLISDLFPQEHRTFAFSLYAIGSQAGYPLTSFNRPMIGLFGWRGTF
jgi:MFS family permease